ncbi:MAG: phosphate ABC transporter substrate-binding protein PstS [Chloroflexi bacterium]|nr:phosphate ABC transporter substrate-binding protein PstS [Chloroflexota bacterium]
MRLRLLAALGVLALVPISACDSGAAQPTATTPTGAATATTSTTSITAATPVFSTQGTATITNTASGTTVNTPGGTPSGSMASGGSPGYPGGSANLTGAGSTFINPLMSKWTQQYNKLYSGVKLNYQSIGSGGGRQQFLAKTVDFGATDAPLTNDQFSQAGGEANALHIPIAMGGVVLAYNLPEVATQLKLDGTTIANIYLLNIKSWNDPAIAALNPGVTLPNQPIAVVHRSDGSGTTDIFTDYLNKVSPDWKSKVGRGTSVQWPGGIGAQGNEGVTNQIKLTKGGIGYIELGYAKSNNLPYALLKNQSGKFVDATASNVADAADSLINTSIPADLRYSITNAPGADAYPIAGTTWILAYTNQPDANKGKILAYFLWWASHDGQQYSEQLSYSPLPRSIQQRVEAQIAKLKCGGGNCFP